MLESKRRAIIFFIIAIILAAISGYLVLKKVQTLNEDLGEMVEVYVANRDIISRAIITRDDLSTIQIPQRYFREEFITDQSEFVNNVSIVPLSAGEIITKSMLKEASSVTEQHNRLVAVQKSNNIYFDEPLLPLDRVDIIVSRDVDGEKVTEVFMEDIKVVQTAGSGQGFQGALLEVPFDDVTEVIHMQHYAERFRVIRSNVGQQPQLDTENEVQEEIDEENQEDMENNEQDEAAE